MNDGTRRGPINRTRRGRAKARPILRIPPHAHEVPTSTLATRDLPRRTSSGAAPAAETLPLTKRIERRAVGLRGDANARRNLSATPGGRSRHARAPVIPDEPDVANALTRRRPAAEQKPWCE